MTSPVISFVCKKIRDEYKVTVVVTVVAHQSQCEIFCRITGWNSHCVWTWKATVYGEH